MNTVFARSISTLSKYLIIALFLVLSSCKDDEEVVTEKYQWVLSSLTPTPDMYVNYLKIGPEGTLYGLGGAEGGQMVAKFENGEWKKMAELTGIGWLGDYTILNDTVYYTSEKGLRKTRNDFTESLLETPLFAPLETYDDKIFITAPKIPYEGDDYTIMAYDGKNFQPIDQGSPMYMMKRVGKKLFISGNPMKVYDGTKLSSTEYSGGFLNIDNEESIYNWVNPNDSRVVINKTVNGKLQDVGQNIRTSATIWCLEFYNNTIIVTGQRNTSLEGLTYYLNSHDEWFPIESTFTIYQLINFEGEVYGITDERQIVQLVVKQ